MISHDVLHMGIPVLDKAIRTVGVYLGIVVLLRLAGKRDLAQLNSFDLVVIMLLSNVVQNAIIGPDNSLTGGLLGAVILVALNAVGVRVFTSSRLAVRLFEGSPTEVVHDGQVDRQNLRRLGIRRVDLEQALHHQGADDLSQVSEASLEPGGTIIVRQNPRDQAATKGDLADLERRLLAAVSGPPPAGCR